jgi:DNA-binding phage protein
MALTREFRQTVQRRVRRDPRFARALLGEAVQAMLSGDVEAGKTLARDYINATLGFETLGDRVGIPPKSLMRMFSQSGNPQARNLFAVLEVLQRDAGIRLQVVPSGRKIRAEASTEP